jgi:hypothetical protein
MEGDVPIPQGHFVYACYVCLLHVASGRLGQEMTPDDTGGYTTGLQEKRGNGTSSEKEKRDKMVRVTLILNI